MFRDGRARGHDAAGRRARVPAEPSVVKLDGDKRVGRHGGDIKNADRAGPRRASAGGLRLRAPCRVQRAVRAGARHCCSAIDSEDDRVFTLHLRKGHRWSDGAPFTTEDFRYWWEDVANHPELSPSGPPVDMLVDGEPPIFRSHRRDHGAVQLGQPQPVVSRAARRGVAACSSTGLRTS